LRDALHLLMAAALSELPSTARILVVGAGTGPELLFLARRFPEWRFTAVEPSLPMLEVCRRKAVESRIDSRCEFHGGYLDSLPAGAPHHAATSLLVSQFLLDRDHRTTYFRAVAERLVPAGLLVTADLASHADVSTSRELMEMWLRMMRGADVPAENLEKLRAAYGRDVSVLPPGEVEAIIAAGGFESPLQFLQTGMIHAWLARRKS
jgi:tRNA (cmo5U34)-methyltransferase